MPVAEANEVEVGDANHYEFAFHVLPTVTEGEVPTVFEAIKAVIIKAGGEVTTEEAPQRIELAYEIVKAIDGKNRKFGSAYLGWVRFTLEGEALSGLTHELEEKTEILRSLMIKLTRVEEENPFYYHEAMASQSKITTIEEVAVAEKDSDDEEGADTAEMADEAAAETEDETKKAEDDTVEVSESELDDSLEKITK